MTCSFRRPGYRVVTHRCFILLPHLYVSVQWNWPGAVWAPPLSRLWGPPALPGLPEHAAGPGRPHGPLGLSSWSPGGAAPDGHQQRLFGRGCSAGGQTQVGHKARDAALRAAHSWASTSRLRFQNKKDLMNSWRSESARCSESTEFLIWALNTVTLSVCWWFRCCCNYKLC